jgi:hypothetical protein
VERSGGNSNDNELRSQRLIESPCAQYIIGSQSCVASRGSLNPGMLNSLDKI